MFGREFTASQDFISGLESGRWGGGIMCGREIIAFQDWSLGAGVVELCLVDNLQHLRTVVWALG